MTTADTEKATSETFAEFFKEAMRSYEKALKSGIQLQKHETYSKAIAITTV